MALSPAKLAERIEKWAAAGFNVAIVDSMVASLQQDKTDSQGRAPRKSGRLASTIRVMRPTSTAAARRGVILAQLAAGNRKSKEEGGVPYARVTQTGGIFVSPSTNATHTRRHDIRARAGRYTAKGKFVSGVIPMRIGGRIVFTRGVKHPGSKFKAQPFLSIDRTRAGARLDAAVQASANKELAG